MNVCILSYDNFCREKLAKVYQEIRDSKEAYENMEVFCINTSGLSREEISNLRERITTPCLFVIDLILRSTDDDGCISSHDATDARNLYDYWRKDPRNRFIFTFFHSCGNELWKRWMSDNNQIGIDRVARFADYCRFSSYETLYEKHLAAVTKLLPDAVPVPIMHS